MSRKLTLLEAFLTLRRPDLSGDIEEKRLMGEAADVLDAEVAKLGRLCDVDSDCAQLVLLGLCSRDQRNLDRLRETMVSDGQVRKYLKVSLRRKGIDQGKKHGKEVSVAPDGDEGEAGPGPVLSIELREVKQAWKVLSERVTPAAAARKRAPASAAFLESFGHLESLANGELEIADLVESPAPGLSPEVEAKARKDARNKVDQRLSRCRADIALEIDGMERSGAIGQEDAAAMRMALDACRAKAKPNRK